MRELMPCGTHAAYRRHQKAGETPCPPCKEAARSESEKQRRARGVKPMNRAVCGTYSGWLRHYKDKTTYCGPCWRAARIYWRDQKRRTEGYARSRWRKVESRTRIEDCILDVCETYYPDVLPTSVLVDRVLMVHPEWKAASVNDVLKSRTGDKLDRVVLPGSLELGWRARSAWWEEDTA